MTVAKRALFERFGRLDTWIVGIQYYGGARQAEDREVFFERDPDNPFDARAVAVYAEDGTQVGHLPHYDAAYFSPLMAEGAIALKGRAGASERGDRLPLSLEVYATSKVSDILSHDARDDWRAIYHNLLVDVWGRLGGFTSPTLEAFRDRFRPLAHKEDIYPKTQFLYRMLKARIADLEREEHERLRARIVAAVEGMAFGPLLGWPELTVVPLYEPGLAVERPVQPAADASPCTAVTPIESLPPDLPRHLPLRCPYPAGARGSAIVSRGVWEALHWFDSPECAQVYWYPAILGDGGAAERGGPGVPAIVPEPVAPESVKACILDTLRNAKCEWGERAEESGLARVEISTDSLGGHAVYRGEVLTRIRLGGQDRYDADEQDAEVRKPRRLPPGRPDAQHDRG